MVALAPTVSTTAAGASPVGESAAAAPAGDAPLSDCECEAFGEAIARLYNEGRMGELLKLFDPYVLADRVLLGMDLPAKDRQGFIAGYVVSVRESLGVQFAKFTDARFLRVQEVDGEKRVLVRLLTADRALAYHAYVVGRRKSGALKWVDCHVYTSGEQLSATARRMVLPMFAENNASLLQRLTRGEGLYVKNLAKITEVQEKLKAGDPTGAMGIIEAMPPEVRETKMVLAIRLQVAQKLSNEQYLEVMNEWERVFPGDPALALIGIDAAYLRQDYARAVDCLDALEQQLGTDPYLEFLKANTEYRAGRVEACRTAARAALALDPRMARVYDVLLQVELDAKNHAATAALLDEVEAAFPGADMEANIADIDAYAEFHASPEHARWLEAREGRSVAAD